jgi:hypothetical protein
MSASSRPAPPGPIDVPLKQWQYDVFWAIVTVLAIGAVVGVAATARTSGGRIAGGLGFGIGPVLCVLAWVNIHRHPEQLQISNEAIVRSAKGLDKYTVTLWKELSPDLVFVLVRRSRGAHWALAQPGSTARVDVQNFRRQDVIDACRARGWHLTPAPTKSWR